MNARLRIPLENDWPAILRAANASLPWQVEGNRQWLENRMKFDDRAYPRRHYVAQEVSSGEICGYGSIEGCGTPDRYRVFVVMDPALLDSVGETLFERLDEDLTSLGGRIAWVREETRDLPLLEFFRRHGFAGERTFTTEQGLEIVTLERNQKAAGVD